MDDPAVEAAFADLEARSPRQAELARIAWEDLVGTAFDDDERGDGEAESGEGSEAAARARGAEITQIQLQELLWRHVHFKWFIPEDPNHAPWLADVREGLAFVFGRVGLDRYAFLCRSSLTEMVHDAFARSDDEGWQAYLAAGKRSGVVPPDLDDLVWGELMGLAETEAFYHVSSVLEAAVAAGTLVPGGRAWKQRQKEIASATLDVPEPERGGQTRRERIMAERRDSWGRATNGIALGALRKSSLPEIAKPGVLPEPLERSVRPLQWLMNAIGTGTQLTPGGNLSRAFSAAAADALGWKVFETRVWSESDVPNLCWMHELLPKLRAVRRDGRKLLLTKTGAAMAAEPSRTWDALVSMFAELPGPEGMALEITLLLLLGPEPQGEDLLMDRVAALMTDYGYRMSPDSRPVEGLDVRGSTAMPRNVLEALLLLEESGPWQSRKLMLTAAGHALARAVLQRRATAPTKRPR